VTRLILGLNFRAGTQSTFPELAHGVTLVDKDADDAIVYPEPGQASTGVVIDQPGWLYRRIDKASDGLDESLVRVDLDIRAQRKYVGQYDILKLVLDNIAAASGTMIVSGLVRILLKTP